MFSLEKQKVRITSYNARAETHGAEQVPAADLRIAFDAPNDVLSEFHSMLRHSLYWKAESSPQQQGELIEPVSDLPNLRCPLLDQPLGLTWEGTGYSVVVDYGLGGKSNLHIEGVDVNAITIDAKEGGTVTVSARLQFKPDEKVAGKLSTMVKQEVTIDLLPPEAEELREAA